MTGVQELIDRSIPFLEVVKNRTAGAELELRLNGTYGPGSALYDDLARMIRDGVRDGWAANIEVDGRRYRRSRLAEPSAELDYFSVTAVYMDSVEPYRGQYHQHPHGELNLVVPLDEGAKLMGPRGWSGPGWTAPGPGSHHYPEVKGGALIALFYLRAGSRTTSPRPRTETAMEGDVMDSARTIEEALLTRRGCRAFLPTPVPRAEVERLLELAARSASNSNCQPWQVHVLTGAAKQALTVDLLEAFDAEGRAEAGEFAYQPQADQWPEPFRSRQQAFGESLYRDVLGIAADDATGRRGHHRRNYEFFGAPVALIVTVSRGPLLSALVDAGLFVQALMLAARGTGLHTCPQASLIDFHPVLRRHAAVPADQVIVCGIALGYADDSHRVGSQRSSREPITSFARFYDS